MRLWNAVLPVVTLILSFNVKSATLIDTGVIPCDQNLCAGATLSSVVNPDDKWAARFNLESNTTITDMQVWVNTHATLNTSFIMVIYGDNVTTPDITSELFAQNVFVSNTGVDDGMNNQWQGLSNLNLNLNAGNYWLSLELRDGNNYDGYLPTGEFGALNAVGTYAFSNPSNGGWIEAPSSDFAFTVSGNISAVPVPAAIWLFGSGLIGLIGIMKPKVRV